MAHPADVKRDIVLPQRLGLEETFKFATDLYSLEKKKEIHIDLGPSKYISPFSMLFLGTTIRNFCKSNRNKLVLHNFISHTYIGHMGFFQLCGTDYGREIRDEVGVGDYIPITTVRRSDLYEQDADQFQEIQDLIQRHVDRAAEVLARGRNNNEDMFNALSYGLREIFRNVFEHSKSNELYYCGQYWPASGKVEIAVADTGVGIKQGLSDNPNFRYNSDKEAIEYSLLPGVSGKTHLPRRSETWFNSGYGLYMTNRLARNGGNFVIASGATGIHLTARTKSNYYTHFNGTIIRLNIDVNRIGDVSKHLRDFREDAKSISREIFGSSRRPPSAMSLLLRRDFRA